MVVYLAVVLAIMLYMTTGDIRRDRQQRHTRAKIVELVGYRSSIRSCSIENKAVGPRDVGLRRWIMIEMAL
jgi:hypothetical protein